MFTIGILAGAAGLCFVPVPLRRLLCGKDPFAAILSTAVASALFFCSRVVWTQISGGALLVYVGVVLINICTTSGYRHKRKDGGRDERYSTKNNPFFEGLFSGTMLRSIIAMAITYVYQVFTGGDLGALSMIGGFFGGFVVGIYEIFKPLFQ
jgi:hypothetical protein